MGDINWSDEDAASEEVKAVEEESPDVGELPEAKSEGAPEWVKIPDKMKFPRGAQVIFVRFRAELTATPHKGERQVILWPLSEGDEKHAYARSQQDPNRAPGQLAKQMIRAIDGHVVDWGGVNEGPGNVDKFWNEIGGRYRMQLIRLYSKLHILNVDEQRDFFEHCVAVRTAG